MKSAAGRIFNRAKNIKNRQYSILQNRSNVLSERSVDTLAENIGYIKKEYNENMAYFGQDLHRFLHYLPQNLNPKLIYLCDIQPDLLQHSIDQLMHDQILMNKYVIKVDQFDKINDDRGSLNIVPICCDEDLWPFANESLQLIVSNLHLHWVNEVQVVLQRWLESLEPDGTMLGSIMGQDTLQELRIAYTLAENERHGGVSQHISPFISITEMGNLITRLNYTMPTVCSDRMQYEFESVFHLMQYLQDIGENEALLQTRQGTYKDTLQGMAAIYQTLFGTKEKTALATFEQVYFTGWKYHQSQQKPKDRGSAEFSLKTLQEEITVQNPNDPIEFGEIGEDGSDSEK